MSFRCHSNRTAVTLVFLFINTRVKTSDKYNNLANTFQLFVLYS